MEPNDFFKSIAAIEQFEGSHDLSRYHPAPGDWLVAIFDVIGSTKAIEEDRYKDVNAVGVCCITAALHALDGMDLPYVFGGDGATLLMPSTSRDSMASAMLGLQQITQRDFGLDLRTGMVSVDTLRARGADVLVGRFVLSSSKSVALFAGGGVQLADHLVKDPAEGEAFRVELTDQSLETADADTTGYSCRWRPIKSRHGTILTGLIQAQESGVMAPYEQSIELLYSVVGDPRDRNPVSNPDKALSGRWSDYRKEIALQDPHGPWWRRFWSQLIIFRNVQLGRLFTALGLKLGGYDGRHYQRVMAEQTDHLRFDDTLRFVIDVSERECETLIEGFEALYQNGSIFYGTQTSQSALMTCIVNDFDTDHVHFLDGGDGGFTMAAKGMKAQIKAAEL